MGSGIGAAEEAAVEVGGEVDGRVLERLRHLESCLGVAVEVGYVNVR